MNLRNGSLGYASYGIDYWTGVATSSTVAAYDFDFGTSLIYPSHDYYRWYGFAGWWILRFLICGVVCW